MQKHVIFSQHTTSFSLSFFPITTSQLPNLTFSQHFSSTEIWSHDPWFARPVSYRCATAAYAYIILKYGAVAVLAWVLTNPWNFNEGFLNPWILNRLLSNCNKTSHLKIWNYLGKRKNEKHFATFLLCGHLYSRLSFEIPVFEILMQPLSIKGILQKLEQIYNRKTHINNEVIKIFVRSYIN